MKRNVDMSEISDGRMYTANDMVKADTAGCVNCSACCHGMGNSIILDPYDIFQISRELEISFEQMMENWVELNVVDGIILPNLKMAGETETCSFLDDQGRCRIHKARPGFCRLFPLGRYYEGRDFRYFLQVHECPKANKAKVKVKKWLDLPQLARYEDYVRDWHYYLEDVQHLLDQGSDELRKQVSMYLLKEFYLKPWDMDRDFYEQFEERLRSGKQYAGLGVV